MDRCQTTARQNEQKQIPGPDGIHLRVLCEVKDERAELLITESISGSQWEPGSK